MELLYQLSYLGAKIVAAFIRRSSSRAESVGGPAELPGHKINRKSRIAAK